MKGSIMEASKSNVKTITPNALPMGHALLKGKISNRRRINGSDGQFWLTVIKLPAKDEFSHPGTVEVVSHAPVGDVDNDWQGVVEVTGYPRFYNSKPDPETGEIRRINSANIRLRVIEE
jgi:hypothetical protein